MDEQFIPPGPSLGGPGAAAQRNRANAALVAVRQWAIEQAHATVPASFTEGRDERILTAARKYEAFVLRGPEERR